MFCSKSYDIYISGRFFVTVRTDFPYTLDNLVKYIIQKYDGCGESDANQSVFVYNCNTEEIKLMNGSYIDNFMFEQKNNDIDMLLKQIDDKYINEYNLDRYDFDENINENIDKDLYELIENEFQCHTENEISLFNETEKNELDHTNTSLIVCNLTHNDLYNEEICEHLFVFKTTKTDVTQYLAKIKYILDRIMRGSIINIHNFYKVDIENRQWVNVI